MYTGFYSYAEGGIRKRLNKPTGESMIGNQHIILEWTVGLRNGKRYNEICWVWPNYEGPRQPQNYPKTLVTVNAYAA